MLSLLLLCIWLHTRLKSDKDEGCRHRQGGADTRTLLGFWAGYAHIGCLAQSVLKSSVRERNNNKAQKVGLQASLKWTCWYDKLTMAVKVWHGSSWLRGGDLRQGLADECLQAAWWRGGGNGQLSRLFMRTFLQFSLPPCLTGNFHPLLQCFSLPMYIGSGPLGPIYVLCGS